MLRDKSAAEIIAAAGADADDERDALAAVEVRDRVGNSGRDDRRQGHGNRKHPERAAVHLSAILRLLDFSTWPGQDASENRGQSTEVAPAGGANKKPAAEFAAGF